jgi:hypothetical protein
VETGRCPHRRCESAALAIGHTAGAHSVSVFAPAGGALLDALFPTSVRASAAGWWLVAGAVGAAAGLAVVRAVADPGNRFALAALLTFCPAALAAGLLRLLPEARGNKPDDRWPSP